MNSGDRFSRDWASDVKSFAFVWGLPIAAMIVAAPFSALVKMIVWTGALLWMGAACLTNARRCGRTHCRFTGPFLIAMAALSLFHGTGILPLGSSGWALIAAISAAGSAAIWFGSERILGKYSA